VAGRRPASLIEERSEDPIGWGGVWRSEADSHKRGRLYNLNASRLAHPYRLAQTVGKLLHPPEILRTLCMPDDWR
jgi:hypothetical protein